MGAFDPDGMFDYLKLEGFVYYSAQSQDHQHVEKHAA
jgi:hypothetical protein